MPHHRRQGAQTKRSNLGTVNPADNSGQRGRVRGGGERGGSGGRGAVSGMKNPGNKIERNSGSGGGRLLGRDDYTREDESVSLCVDLSISESSLVDPKLVDQNTLQFTTR